MVNIASEHTNAVTRIHNNYATENKTVSLLDKGEFGAFLRILLLPASQKDNHMPIKNLINTD